MKIRDYYADVLKDAKGKDPDYEDLKITLSK
jgi:hypothetical protein